MYPQEQEHWDYEMGAASELQNALSLSRMEFQDDSAKIKRLIADGKFVVVRQSAAYCPRTDAAMGERRTLLKTCDTRSEADDYCNSVQPDDDDLEVGVCVMPRLPVPEPEPTPKEFDDIPF